MPSKISSVHFTSALKNTDIRFWIGSVGFFTLGSRALAVVIGFQIYKITHSALCLGWLGLVEAIPALCLVLVGGYVADHFNRRKILLITRASSRARSTACGPPASRWWSRWAIWPLRAASCKCRFPSSPHPRRPLRGRPKLCARGSIQRRPFADAEAASYRRRNRWAGLRRAKRRAGCCRAPD